MYVVKWDGAVMGEFTTNAEAVDCLMALPGNGSADATIVNTSATGIRLEAVKRLNQQQRRTARITRKHSKWTSM